IRRRPEASDGFLVLVRHRTVTRELLAVALGSRAVADGAVLRQPAGVPARPCVRLRVPIVLQELAELPQLLRQDDERALRPNGQHGDRLAAFSNGLGSCQEYWLLPVQCLLGWVRERNPARHGTYRAESMYRLEKTGIGREPLLFRVHYWVRGIAECVSAAITPRMTLTSFQTYALLPPPGDVNESDYFTVLRGFFPMDTL